LSTRDPTPLLNLAKQKFAKESLLGILGPPKCGKTVVAALLHHSIVNNFIQKNPNYTLKVNDGIDFLKKTSLIIRSGEFPIKTPESDINEVEMILTQQKASSLPIQFKIYDIAGEVYDELFGEESLPEQELAYRILSHEKSKTEQFGPMSFIMFCNIYVFMIDCQKFREWGELSFEYMKILNSITKLKKLTGEGDGKMITNLIGIMFTKYDMLDEKNRMANPKNLLKTHMREFYEQLNSTVQGDIEYFKMHIDIQRNPDNSPKVVEETKTITEEGEGGETKSKTIIEKKFLVKIPLSYSEKEYNRFISWIDSNVKG